MTEQPDFVFGPAYKGIPIAALTGLLLGQNHDVRIGFDLEADARIDIPHILSRYAKDVKEFARIRAPPLLKSDELNDWARYYARALVDLYDDDHRRNLPGGLGFNTIVADGSAIPAAAALAYHLSGNPGVDPDFAIPRRSRKALERAKSTKTEIKNFYRHNPNLSEEEAEEQSTKDAMERLIVGQVRDHARYRLVSRYKEEKSTLLADLGRPEGDKHIYNALIADDSILTGETVKKWSEALKIKYGDDVRILGGVFAVHFQILPPNIRQQRRDNTAMRRDVMNRVPLLKAAIDSDDIMEYLYYNDRVASEVWQKYQQSRENYGTGWKLGVL